MRSKLLKSILFIASGLLSLSGVIGAQCKLIDNSRDAVFITFERIDLVNVEGKEKMQNGVILRLHNNSSCEVLIKSGSAEKFFKPLPPKPTILQILHREIDYTLADGVLLPETQYTYYTSRNSSRSVGGDMFFGFGLLGGRSLLFEVPATHLDFKHNGKIVVEFEYSWEQESRAKNNYGSVDNLMSFYVAQIPEAARRRLTKKIRYSTVWFAPINDPKKPDWEILPQEAKAREVILSKRNELGILSNFAATPFEMDGKRYASVEGFWQMMLYPEGPDDERAKDKRVTWKYTREQVAQMTAFEAKSAGTLAEENMKTLGIDWVTYQGKRFPYRSATPGEHYKFILAAMRAKLNQNPDVKRILLATGDLILKPDHHGEENPPPEWKYYEIWMQLRAETRP